MITRAILLSCAVVISCRALAACPDNLTPVAGPDVPEAHIFELYVPACQCKVPGSYIAFDAGSAEHGQAT